jgi:hypothetical protein
MKQLPRKTVEKTKPICKNEKTNLNSCSEMTYEGKCPSDYPKNKANQTRSAAKIPKGEFLETSNRGSKVYPSFSA